MNNSWNLQNDAPSYKPYPKGWHNQDPKTSFNTRPVQAAEPEYFTGKASNALNVCGTVGDYYSGR